MSLSKIQHVMKGKPMVFLLTAIFEPTESIDSLHAKATRHTLSITAINLCVILTHCDDKYKLESRIKNLVIAQK